MDANLKQVCYQVSYSFGTPPPYFEASRKVRINSRGMDPRAKASKEVDEITLFQKGKFHSYEKKGKITANHSIPKKKKQELPWVAYSFDLASTPTSES